MVSPTTAFRCPTRRCKGRIFRSAAALRAHLSRCRRPQFPGVEFGAEVQARGFSLGGLARAAGYRVPSGGVVTRISEFIHGKRQPGPRMLLRLLQAAGMANDLKWWPWLPMKARGLVCLDCGREYMRRNLRPEEQARLKLRPDGRWGGLRCGDCGHRAAGAHRNSREALAEARQDHLKEMPEMLRGLAREQVRLIASDPERMRGVQAARGPWMLERFAEKLRQEDPHADPLEEFERRRKAGMAAPGSRARRAAAIWLGRTLKRHPVRGLRLCLLCELVARSVNRWRTGGRNNFHPICWRAVLRWWSRRKMSGRPSTKMFARLHETKPGPRRERSLDRDFYALVAVYSGAMTEEALLERMPKVVHGGRPFRTKSAVSMAISRVVSRLPGDARLFLPSPAARHFQHYRKLGDCLAARAKGSERDDDRIKLLWDYEMPEEQIARLTRTSVDYVRRVVSLARAAHA